MSQKKVQTVAPEAKEVTPTEDSQNSKKRAEELRKAVKETADIAETLSEPYRLKCFEILLPFFLSGSIGVAPPQLTAVPPASRQKSMIRLEVKALLRQYSVPEQIVLDNLFLEGEIFPTYTIKPEKDTKKSRIQIMNALLIALENALKTGVFNFSMEQVRTKMKGDRAYDPQNFKNNFNNSKDYFTSLSTEDNIQLSSDGKAELAEILLGLPKK